jgi:hypothetical protein
LQVVVVVVLAMVVVVAPVDFALGQAFYLLPARHIQSQLALAALEKLLEQMQMAILATIQFFRQ